MALDLTPEQKETGKANFHRVVGKLAEADQEAARQGISRRRFMQGLIGAGAALPISAAAYYGYSNSSFREEPVRAGLIGAGDEGGVLVGEHNPNFVKFVACCDIRPSNRERIFKGEPPPSPRLGFNHHYGSNAREHITWYDDYRRLLDDRNVEMVVIALPLHLHAEVAIAAMRKGKHVLCEKLMAWNIRQCKRMIRTADDTGLLLAIGHQRHYSMLYAHAYDVIQSGVLGDIRHIRALWHRNNTLPRLDASGRPRFDPRTNLPLYRDSWRPEIASEDRAIPDSVLKTREGYASLEELVRWRLYRRTGGGLMAELGSHQLDACSIFLGKKHPLAVSAVGGTYFYRDDREVEDHVYCTFEFPGVNYDPNARDPRRNDIVVVTYSSISTNAFENYGECVMGTRGTLIVEKEENAFLYAGAGAAPRATEVTASTGGSQPALDTSASTAPTERRAQAVGQNALGTNTPSRGYKEEMEHMAFCIRMRKQGMESDRAELQPRCGGRAAMADAIIALTANQAMQHRRRIVFENAWFDPASDAVPDADA
jgi:predicted dehydrogenase